MIRLINCFMILYCFMERQYVKMHELWQYRSEVRKSARRRVEASRHPKMGTRTSAQFLPLSAFESAWTRRKRRAFMRPRALCTRYNIRLHCDSAIIGTAAPLRVIRICECVEPSSLTTRGRERAVLNSDRIYRAVRTFVLISDAAPTNCSYVLRHLRQVLVLIPARP